MLKRHHAMRTSMLGLVVALLGPTITVGAEPAVAGASSAQMVEGQDASKWGYMPVPITIAAGQDLVWTNVGQVPHTATDDSGTWDTGLVLPGGTASQTFGAAGTFAFHCTLHPWMKGTLVVSGAPASADDGAPSETSAPEGETTDAT